MEPMVEKGEPVVAAAGAAAGVVRVLAPPLAPPPRLPPRPGARPDMMMMKGMKRIDVGKGRMKDGAEDLSREEE